MNRFSAALLLALIALPSFAARPNRARLVNMGGACDTTHIAGCDTVVSGAIESGDCAFSDGTRYDSFTITLPPQRSVSVTLRPLAASYTNPWLGIVAPRGDPSVPPAIFGPVASTVWIQTGATGGTWTIAAGTEDLFAAGAYVLHIDCHPLESNARDCVTQELLCGHTADALLSAESCRMGETNKAYAAYAFYGVQGDVITVEMESFGFDPLFGIYDADNRLLESAGRDNSFTARANRFIDKTGWYYVLASTVDENRAGLYSIKLSCGISGCLFPYFRQPVPDQTVARGETATVDLDLSVIGAFDSSLLEDLNTVATSPGARLTTPPITARRQLVAEVVTPCGSARSNAFTIAPDGTKRRSVRHR
jgi:hypothetical protein